jgi:cytidylate kinase
VSSNVRVILISGFTAAGKTTHAKLLATYLGWGYLGASEIRRRLHPSVNLRSGQEWQPAIDAERSNSLKFDKMLDNVISEEIKKSHAPIVVDAWLQPWLYREDDALRVWLHSDDASRVKKAQVSSLRLGISPPPNIAERVKAKDDFSVEMFRRLYGIRFAYTHELFRAWGDNSRYIKESTIATSDRGIAEYQALFEGLIEKNL